MRSHSSTLVRPLALVLLSLCALLGAVAPARADDSQAPQLTAFSLTPKHVDTSTQAQVVNIGFTVTDDQPGVGWAIARLHPTLPGSAQEVESRLDRVAEGALSAHYEGTATLPRGSISGEWGAEVIVGDVTGNVDGLLWWTLDTQFGPGAGTLVNDAATCDTTPPHVTAFSITPSHVDTTSVDQTFVVSATLADDSGVEHGMASLTSGSGQTTGAWLQLVSGDATHGDYTGVVTLHRGSQPGVWKAEIDSLGDSLGNAANVDLVNQFGAAAQVTNDATTWDSQPPRVRSFSISPAEFDTESGSRTLTVTARVTDDLTGVQWFQVTLMPLLNSQRSYTYPVLMSGDATDGVYRGTFTLPRGAKEGLWSPYIAVQDGVGNGVGYGPDDLSALFPDAEGLVLANTASAQTVTVDCDWFLRGTGSLIKFPAGTVITRLGGGSFAVYRMTAQPFSLDGSVATTDLDGVPLATLRMGIPGLDLSFSQPVSVTMDVGDAYDGYRLQIQSLTEGGDAWANEKVADVTAGHITFTVNHATRFAASLKAASITKLAPATGRRKATLVTITGHGFGESRGTSVVRFGGTRCTRFLGWSPERILCYVPARAHFGRLGVSVSIEGLLVSAAGRFTVKR